MRVASVVKLAPMRGERGSDKEKYNTAYPNDEYEIVAYFVMNLARVSLLSARSGGARLMHASRKPYIVDNAAALAADKADTAGESIEGTV